jgi:hypothetical protein
MGPGDLEAVRVTVQFRTRLRTRGCLTKLPALYSAEHSSQRRVQISR